MLQDQISVGLITDRASMVDALADAGFDLPRVGKAYLTAQDPDTGERWRLKGEIFHEDWQADTAERETERGAGHDPAGLRRLDGIPDGELQERFEQNCNHRAPYNRERYPNISATEQELADDLALADHGDVLGGDRLDDGRELALDADASELRDDRLGPDADRQGGRDMAGAGPDEDTSEDLHTGRQISDLHQDRGGLDGDTPDSLGTRLARLRRAVGDGLRGLSKGIERVRGTLDDQDAEPDGWIGRLRVGAHSIANGVRGCVARLVERGLELREAAHATRDQLEISESRRREVETELEEREVDMDRGMTH